MRLCTTEGVVLCLTESSLCVGDCLGGCFPSILMDLLVSATIACLEKQKSGYFLLVLVLSVVLTSMNQFSDVVHCGFFTFCFSWEPGKLASQISST